MEKGKLLVSDFMNYYYDKVILYVCCDNGFKDIYKGKALDIPIEMRNYKITVIGARRKGILDVKAN